MNKFETFATSRLAAFMGGSVLAVGLIWPMVSTAQDPDPQAQHEDNPPAGDQDLVSQIAELHAKVAKLEAALKQNSNGTPSDMPEQQGAADKTDKAQGVAPGERVSAKFQNCLQCHQTRPRGPLPTSHLEWAGGNDNGTVEAGAADGQGAPGPGAGMKMKGRGMSGGKSKGMMGKGMGKGMMGGMGGGNGMTMKGQGGQAMGGEGGKTAGMGGGEAEMGGSTSEAMDQQMKQIQQQMKQMQQQMKQMQQQMQQLMQMQTLQMKVMELQMKVMEMK